MTAAMIISGTVGSSCWRPAYRAARAAVALLAMFAAGWGNCGGAC